MQNRMLIAAVLLTAACGSGLGLVSVYHVDPVKAPWSGWTRLGDTLSEIITCNFDSLAYVELFAGGTGNGGAYTATVCEGNRRLTASVGNKVPEHDWVRFANWNETIAFTKGKKYEVRFTRGGGDSIQFYYDSRNPYHYGEMIEPNRQSVPVSFDLAMRCYGRMKPVDDVWRACSNHGDDPRPNSGGTLALVKAKSMGVKWLKDDFLCWGTWADSQDKVMGIYHRYLDSGFNMIGVLCYGRNDSTISSGPVGAGSLGNYPPRYLWAQQDSGQINYWAEYCRSIMESMPAVKYWLVWTEANANWYWKDPDIAWYHGSGGANDTIDTPRERCSLYVRMCRIAESTARALGGDTLRKVIGGEAFRLVDPIDNGATGVDWLRYMFDIAKHDYGAAESCFDVVSVHPYMFYDDRPYFTEKDFRISLDTTRWVMRQAGYPGMELWATEYGWPRWDKKDSFRPLTDTLMQARNVCKFYTSAIARQADPRGGYDRAIHYELTSRHVAWADNDGFGLLDSLPSQPRLPHGWAFTQVGNALAGKRCNGRVMDGDTAADNHVRMYEFEDMNGKRIWVCWKDDDSQRCVGVKLPARTDNLAAESLAYTRTPPAFSPRVANDGWLSVSLNSRPVFITEKAAPQRPDLRVDSGQYVRTDRVVRAWVTNHGTRVTPVRSGTRVPYPTWAVLRANGDSLAQQVWTTSLAVNQQAEFTFDLGQTKLPDTVLLSVTVNPSQTYVELEADDNTGYTLAIKP